MAEGACSLAAASKSILPVLLILVCMYRLNTLQAFVNGGVPVLNGNLGGGSNNVPALLPLGSRGSPFISYNVQRNCTP